MRKTAAPDPPPQTAPTPQAPPPWRRHAGGLPAASPAAFLFRLLRVQRHGHRPGADVRLCVPGELQLPLHLPLSGGVLAAVAHLPDHLVPGVRLLPPVGQQHLLGQPHGEPLDAGDEFLHALRPALQLVRHGAVLDNGSGDELGEEGDVRAEGHRVPLDRGRPAVDINGVAHGLEGVEADADGQGETQNGETQARQAVDAFGQEIPVLEEHQDGQIKEDRRGHRHPGPAVILTI